MDKARVSLIVLRAPGMPWPAERVASYRQALEDSGRSIEVLTVSEPDSGRDTVDEGPWGQAIVAELPGRNESAAAGLRAANGELLVVVDLAIPYSFDEVLAVVDALENASAEMVIACRPSAILGGLSRRTLGLSDPGSGLIGLTRDCALEVSGDSAAPVGSRIALELARRFDGIPVETPARKFRRIPTKSSILDDLRIAKRLSDDRFGNASRLIQFCFVGASGTVVDLTIYAILKAIFAQTKLAGMTAPIVGGSMAPAVAGLLGIATALTWNFSINRRLTFNDARPGSVSGQFLRYVLSNLVGIGISLSLRLILPTQVGFFRNHQLMAAAVGIVAATGFSFSLTRWFVFGTKSEPKESTTETVTTGVGEDRPSLVPNRLLRVSCASLEGSTASTRPARDRVAR